MSAAPDFDAIVASGLNRAEHSARLLAAHDVFQRRGLHAAMRAKWMEAHPAATSEQIAAFSQALWREIGHGGICA